MSVEQPVAPAVAVRERLEWVDAARGYCVALVVAAHVVLWHLLSGDVAADRLATSAWGWVYGVLGSVRMPLLLAVSGLVVAHRVRAGWRRGGLGVRVTRNYHLYVVWLVVYALFYAVVRDPGLPHRVDGPLDVLRQLVVPGTTLWYVFALAVYIAVLGALHRVHPAVVLGGAAVLMVVTHATTDSDQVWSKVPELMVFFALGVHAAGPLRRLAAAARPLWLPPAAAAAVAATAAGRLAGGHAVAEALVALVRGTAFLVLALLLVALVVRWAPARRLGLALGRRTLPVYVIHPLVIAVWIVLAAGPLHGPLEQALAVPVAALLYPAVLTVAVVAACLGVHAAARAVRLEVPLFAMPASWAARLEPRAVTSGERS